ncbi:MAG: aldo/keto reductase [Erysipelotrichaceae bacterium]|nr:aldo/keto reductase [Erysipelotrichaceae bacterium]
MLDEKFVKDMPKFGFGLMRLPKVEGSEGEIDVEQVATMANMFFDAGFRYCDTAYVYAGSEVASNKAIVSRHDRDSFYITSKINVNAAKDAESCKAELDESLKRLGTDHIDFYLLHAISRNSIDRFEDWGIWDFVKQAKEEGKIRHYGFSFHDSAAFLDELLTRHPDVEFVQLQINYADWNNPIVESGKCYEVARKHNKPIIVMEPVKGGALANPPKPVADILHKANPNVSYASWAIRFVASLPGVMVVLSGMSNIAQMEDNLSFMKDFQPLSEEEQEVVKQAREALEAIDQVPCTACKYCVEGCPMQIRIPDIFRAMNSALIYGNVERAKASYKDCVDEGHAKASECIKCGQCENQCPQHIEIRNWLDKVAETLED